MLDLQAVDPGTHHCATGQPMADEAIAPRAKAAWHVMGGQARWGEAPSCTVCEFNGRRLIWPEGADVIDLDRCAVVTLEELPEADALKLPWRPVEGWSPEPVCMPGPLL
jgi:hypothetical protein